jgi:ribosomal protein L11 methyltransferase
VVPPLPDAWTTVVVDVDADDAELVADVLWQAGAAAIEEQAVGAAVRLLAGYPSPAQANTAADQLRRAGRSVVAVTPVTDDGHDGWRPFARVERAGRVVLVPAWLDVPATGADDLVIRLDPGPTFGSGSHPTTRLVAAVTVERVRPRDTVLDVGTGSGVLAVVAARAGAGRVVGLDIDPASAEVAAANARRNGVAERVRVDPRPLAAVSAEGLQFDLVLANLLAPVVVELAADLVAAVGPRGRLVVSGLLADRWAEAVDLLHGLVVEDVRTEDGWAAVTLHHRGRGTDGP